MGGEVNENIENIKSYEIIFSEDILQREGARGLFKGKRSLEKYSEIYL